MRPPLALALAALAGCSSPEDRAARARLFSAGEARAATAPFDWQHPERSLAMDADEVAARLGSFDWSASVSWTAIGSRPDARVHLAERHAVRQSAGGDFEVQSDLDPGGPAGAETGMRVIRAGGMTYARSRHAPFGAWRERPTDRGRDARRYRDESFGLAADLLRLTGPPRMRPAGEVSLLGRPARRFALSLDPDGRREEPSRLGAGLPEGGPDDDTRRRLAFLDGREPARLDGELLADAASGAPLKVHLRAVFTVRGDPGARLEVELAAQMRALGAAAAAVEPPSEVLPDERKPRGVARALEAAGLRKRGEAEKEEEAADEGE